MKDRIAGAPGRYSAVVTGGEYQKLLNGQPFAITMTRDDNPVEEGTPYSKAAVLPDGLATLLCPDIEDPTPADALGALQVNKAPAGYGLGEAHGRYCSDCHAFAEGGFYYVDSNTANNPTAGSGSLFVQPILTTNGTDFYLTLKSGAIIWHCYYSSFAGAWQPWECENPPMELGVEYRTTERWNGKPVYTKLMNYGMFSEGKTADVTVYNEDGTFDAYVDLIRVIGLVHLVNEDRIAQYAYLQFDSIYLRIENEGWNDSEMVNCYAQTWYVKYV